MIGLGWVGERYQCTYVASDECGSSTLLDAPVGAGEMQREPACRGMCVSSPCDVKCWSVSDYIKKAHTAVVREKAKMRAWAVLVVVALVAVAYAQVTPESAHCLTWDTSSVCNYETVCRCVHLSHA
jgi:hypothetical protein